MDSFKSEIHWGAAEILVYIRALTSQPCKSASFEEIQAFNEEYEQKRLELGNVEARPKAYLPARRTTSTQGNY